VPPAAFAEQLTAARRERKAESDFDIVVEGYSNLRHAAGA
jgi:hypothetical protein